MKIKTKLRNFFQIENLVTANIVAWSFFYLLKVCNVSLYRLGNAFRDIGTSLYYWYLSTMARLSGSGAPSASVTVNDVPPIDIQDYIPIDLDEFVWRIRNLDTLFFDEENFRMFNIELFFLSYKIILFGMLFLFIFVFIGIICYDLLVEENERENGYVTESYMKLLDFYYSKVKPVAVCVRDYFARLIRRSGTVFILALIYLVAFNVLTMLVEFFAYYFFILSAFDVESMLIQLYKLILDVAIMLSSAPAVVWVVLVAVIYSICSVSVALDRLRHGEAKNCGVVKELPIMVLIVGEMGKGKTALSTDMALTLNNVHKADSLKKMFKFDMQFPLFSWELFEKELSEAMLSNAIKDFTTARIFVDNLEKFYDAAPEEFCLKYGICHEDIPMLKDLGNTQNTLFDAMREYSKAFFVYSCKNPHLSNYSIRTDGHHDSSPFFRLWRGDFFNADRSYSEYSHILDQDIMRLKKLRKPNNPLAGSMGYGIFSVTEYGKSHPNQIESEGIKKDAEESNPKNDGHDMSIKVIRHQDVIIDYDPFVSLLLDEQRAESIPASLRDVLVVVNIIEKSSPKNALPGFFIFDALYDLVYEPMKNTYYEYRNKRGDRTVGTLLFKSVVSCFSNFYQISYNRFGYYEQTLHVASGRAYGNNSDSSVKVREYKWQCAYAKIFADRYATDCYQQFFEKKQLETAYGINNTPQYQSLYASVPELLEHHDHFVDQLIEISNIVIDKNKNGKIIVEKEQETKKQSTHKNVVDDDDCDDFFRR